MNPDVRTWGTNISIRSFFLILTIFPFIFYRDFSDHIAAHLNGGILDVTIQGRWLVVILNILIFLTFLVPLRFRRTVDWKEYGLVSAFFVSLFIEMYGLPFSLIFLSRWVGESNVDLPEYVISFDILGTSFGMTMAMTYGLVLMVVGTVLILLGWVTLYHNITSMTIVDVGIYARSRHPQYLGFILVILGWVIGWPTLLTVVFSGILIALYVHVCRIEERELSNDPSYLEYMGKVPFFI